MARWDDPSQPYAGGQWCVPHIWISGQEWLDPQNADPPLHVADHYVKAHLVRRSFQASGEEQRDSYRTLESAEGKFDGSSADLHGVRSGQTPPPAVRTLRLEGTT